MSTLQSAQSPLIIFETIPVRYPLFADLGLRGLPAPSTGIRSTLTSSCLVGTLTCSRSVLTCLLPQPDRLRAHVYLSFTCTCPSRVPVLSSSLGLCTLGFSSRRSSPIPC